ncbi:MAG: hypothetical protein R3D57_06795 [Hyphomicrobiaceae bacterium]
MISQRSIALTIGLALTVVLMPLTAEAAAPEVKDCASAASDADKKTCHQENIKALRKSVAAAINEKCKAEASTAGSTGMALTLAIQTCTEAKLQDIYKSLAQ